jgi:outer membrane protein OmpA-like peptidoglycan-associated protein
MTGRRVVNKGSCLRIGLLGLSILLMLGGPAPAAEREGSFELGLFVGTTFLASELALPNEVQGGLRFGWNFHEAYELEFQWLHVDDNELESPDSTLIDCAVLFCGDPGRTFGLDSYMLRFLINPTNERRRFKPYVLFGAGLIEYTADPSLASSDEGEIDDVLASIGGGIRYRLSPHLSFRAEFETQYALSDSYHNESVNAGLSWNFGGGAPGDTDRDGVLDLVDHCPDTPRGALVDKHDGCPWDLDQDGIMEGLDKCPDTQGGWPVDESGCPLDSDGDAVPDGADDCVDTPMGAIVDERGCPLDSDGDAILDGLDRCPDTPKGAIVDPTDSPTAGCPNDSDEDGVADGVDQCAITPPGATVDERGCPSDTDGDRILDGLDQCPQTLEGAKIDRDGCPRVRLDKEEPQVLQNVKFLQGAELYPGTEAWIDLLIDALHYWSDVTVELGAYTDSSGTAEGNRQIARRRAEVLRDWIVQSGIDRNRLKTKGYGAVKFIADNDTEQGRDTNRRIEVKYLSGDLSIHEPPPPPPPVEEEPEAPEDEAATTEQPAAGAVEGAAAEQPEAAEEPAAAEEAAADTAHPNAGAEQAEEAEAPADEADGTDGETGEGAPEGTETESESPEPEED